MRSALLAVLGAVLAASATATKRYIVVFPDDEVQASSMPAAEPRPRRYARMRDSAKTMAAALPPGSINVSSHFSHILNGMVSELSDQAVLGFEALGATVVRDRVVSKLSASGPAPTVSTPRPSATTYWNLDRIDQPNLPLNGNYTPDGDGGALAHIFMIDTGINSAHVEFAGRIGDGYDFVDADSDPEDVRTLQSHPPASPCQPH